MKRLLSASLIAVLGFGLAVGDADARRLGGGGMKRSVPTQPARQAPDNTAAPTQPTGPQQAAAPRNAGPTAGAAATQAPRRSWLGPIAGLAAGLGLAALFSHLGMGAAFGEFVTLLLLVLLGVFLVRFLMRRMRPQPQMATAGGSLGSLSSRSSLLPATPVSTGAPRGDSFAPAAATNTATNPLTSSTATAPSGLAASGFDARAFEQIAKQIFVRMQAANDDADFGALRQFTTPHMLETVQHDLQQRDGARQRTDVVQLAAEVIDVGQEQGRDVVSVRYQGLIREVEGDVAQPFDEVWHLVRSDDGGWLLAGIQPSA